jgi:hypothetical protein
MNDKLRRLNESRHYHKKILAKYGENVRIHDLSNLWIIETPIPQMPADPYKRYKELWRGKSLSDAVH